MNTPTSETTTEFDWEALPPDTRLIVYTIAARMRGGEAFWTFEADLLPQLQTAADAGVVWFESATAPDAYRVWLTEPAQVQFLGADWQTPVQRMHGYYMAALDEVHRLRAAAAAEATHVKTLLESLRTIPKTARTTLDAVRARLAAAARGDAERTYRFVSPAVRSEIMRSHGALPVLTRGMWEDACDARLAGPATSDGAYGR